MEEIFSNRGYNTIVIKILTYLDNTSLVNLTKVSKTVCFNMKSIKTCQIYFNKCMETLPQTTKFGISNTFEIETKFQNDLEVEELIGLFNYLGYLCCNPQSQQKRPSSNMPEVSPQYFTQFSQNIQYNIWELLQSICKMNPFHELFDPSEKCENVKLKLVAAFKCIQRCPLILAMEINQKDLAKFLLENDMLYVCNCANLMSIFRHLSPKFDAGIFAYFQSNARCFPREFNLEVARRCYGRHRIPKAHSQQLLGLWRRRK